MSDHQARRAIREAHAAGRLGDLLREALGREPRLELAEALADRCHDCNVPVVEENAETCGSCGATLCSMCEGPDHRAYFCDGYYEPA